MTPQHQAAIAAAIDQLATAIVAAIEVPSRDPGAPDRLYSIPAACDALGIKRSRLYVELDSGRLRSVKSGRRRLIPSSALAAFVAAGQ